VDDAECESTEKLLVSRAETPHVSHGHQHRDANKGSRSQTQGFPHFRAHQSVKRGQSQIDSKRVRDKKIGKIATSYKVLTVRLVLRLCDGRSLKRSNRRRCKSGFLPQFMVYTFSNIFLPTPPSIYPHRDRSNRQITRSAIVRGRSCWNGQSPR
jgi:hypothetical protein